MSVERPLRVSLYWGGRIHYEKDSICYLPHFSNRTFTLRYRIGYEELVDRIYQYMGVNKEMFKLNLFLRQPCGPTSYNVSAVVDNETLDIMYDLWNEIVLYIAELYIEKEEIVQISRVNSVFIGPTGNVGTMMSSVHACMDLTRLRSHSSTIVPKTALASEYMHGDLARDSSESRISARPEGPSSPKTTEDDVYTSGHDRLLASEGDDASENDAEDVEESESQDVFSSDSNEEHEAYGFGIDLKTQQPFNGEVNANTERGDNARDNAYGNLSYVPKGLAFFSNLGSIDDDDLTDEDDLDHIATFNEENNNIRLHMRFESKQQLSRAVRIWSINHNREFKVIESKSNTWVAKCKSAFERSTTTANAPSDPACNWCIRAVKKKTHGLWQITKWVNDHNCLDGLVSNNNTSLTSSVIARHILRNIEDDPGFKVKSIMSYIKDLLKVDVSYKKAWYARREAIKLVYGSSPSTSTTRHKTKQCGTHGKL